MTSETLKTYFASLILTHPLIAPEAHRMGAPQSAGPRGCGWPHVQDGHDGFPLWRQQRGTSQSGEVGYCFMPFVLYCMIPGTGEGKLLYILYTSINCIGGVMFSLVPRLSPCWENLGTRLGDLYCMTPRNR